MADLDDAPAAETVSGQDEELSSGKKQYIAGALAVAFGYAAGIATNFGGVVPDALHALTHDFSPWHLPLHAVFTLATATIGATAMAIVERIQEKPKAPPAP